MIVVSVYMENLSNLFKKHVFRLDFWWSGVMVPISAGDTLT